jgi:hypothetical protein
VTPSTENRQRHLAGGMFKSSLAISLTARHQKDGDKLFHQVENRLLTPPPSSQQQPQRKRADEVTERAPLFIARAMSAASKIYNRCQLKLFTSCESDASRRAESVKIFLHIERFVFVHVSSILLSPRCSSLDEISVRCMRRTLRGHFAASMREQSFTTHTED